ncbi:MAG: alpha/beta hydrolase [Anaerolineae bacterium]|nr:alpha/beta hydrolase [Anaerolineae bacterium]MCA9895664.1 alpha/beta hydrolase [Anaerolineae bacterium]
MNKNSLLQLGVSVADDRAASSPEQKTSNEHRSLRVFKANRSLTSILKMLNILCSISPTLAVRFSTFLFLRPRRKPLNYLDKLPAKGQRITIYHNLRKLVGYQWGAGPRTILLVHGWESHLGYMLPMVQPLVDAGFKVITFDAPGHGQSPQLLTNIIDFGDAVKATIEQHGPVYAVVAHSFGASATSLMLSRERGIKINRFIMLSPMNHVQRQIEIFEKILNYPDFMHERVVNHIYNHLPVPIEQCDVTQAVKRIAAPGLIVHDRGDKVISVDNSYDIAASYVGAVLRDTHGLGHRGIMRSPKVHQWVVDFLNTNPQNN